MLFGEEPTLNYKEKEPAEERLLPFICLQKCLSLKDMCRTIAKVCIPQGQGPNQFIYLGDFRKPLVTRVDTNNCNSEEEAW